MKIFDFLFAGPKQPREVSSVPTFNYSATGTTTFIRPLTCAGSGKWAAYLPPLGESGTAILAGPDYRSCIDCGAVIQVVNGRQAEHWAP